MKSQITKKETGRQARRKRTRYPLERGQHHSVSDPHWLSAREEAELEQKLLQLAYNKYGFNQSTAVQWVKAFIADPADAADSKLKIV